MLTIKELIAKELFIVCSLIPADDFVSFCKERGISTSKEQLELYEKLEIFYPIARVEFPKYKEKIELSADGLSYRLLGTLQGDDDWTGNTRETYGHFWWKKDIAEDFHHEGLLWSPREKPFTSWDTFYDKELECKKIESYYSEFQIYPLYMIAMMTARKISYAWWHTYDDETIGKLVSQIKEMSSERVNALKTVNDLSHEIADVCQIISNRYFPKTQTDKRTINISSGEYGNWNWHEYGRCWNAKAELVDLGIDTDRIGKYQDVMSSRAHYCDPLADWYDLVQFVALDRKKRLKGDAALAQTFYSMEMMLRLFYKDLTGINLREYVGIDPDWKERLYGKSVIESNMAFLECLTNEFHLNPRPKLILIVEGKSEYEQMPRLAREIGYRFDAHGIRVELLEGVGNYVGGKIDRLIDHYHDMQTIVYLMLDNENNTPRFKNKTLKKKSRYGTQRYVTKEEYIFLWDSCFEFDNFTDLEIAHALSNLLPNHSFEREEVANARRQFGAQKDPLSHLFRNKTSKDLAKPMLAARLVDEIVKNMENEYVDGKPRRKLIAKIHEIINLASHNYQPYSSKSWVNKQDSGYFGEKIE